VLRLILEIGTTAFLLMLPVLAGYISYSVAGKKPGLVPGFVGGYLSGQVNAGFSWSYFWPGSLQAMSSSSSRRLPFRNPSGR